MAGIAGQVGFNRHIGLLDRSLRLLRHHPSFKSRVYCEAEGVALGATYRENDPPDHDLSADQRVGLVVYGTPIDPHRGTAASAKQLLDRYRREGITAVTLLDGGFVIVVLDWGKGRLFLVNDRMATLPIHYGQADGLLAFAPEAKAVLQLLGRAPTLDRTGALEFLSMGYAVGSRTLFEDIHLLEPAQVLEVELDTAAVLRRSYWALGFRERTRLREKQAADELFEVLHSTTRSALTPRPASFHLLLTGGYDSRTALAVLCNESLRPDLALTWGVSDEIPGSDVTIARQIAADHETPFQFLRYDHETFPDRAESWAFVSELGSDNLGNFAAGSGYMYELTSVAPAVLNGDQMLGIGGIPLNREDAFQVASGLPFRGVAPGLRALLKSGMDGTAAEHISTGVRRLCEPRWSDTPKNLQDFLGHHLRIARWLNAPTYFREPMVSPRRPLLHYPAIELFMELPEQLRVDKRLLVTMLERRMPHLLRRPVASAKSLVDWDHAFTAPGRTADYFRGLILDERLFASPLVEFLDVRTVSRCLEVYVASAPAPIRRTPGRLGFATRIRRAGSRSRLGSLAISGMQRLVTRSAGRPVGASISKVLKRVALLSLLLRVLDRGWLTTGAPWQDGHNGKDLVPLWDRFPLVAADHS